MIIHKLNENKYHKILLHGEATIQSAPPTHLHSNIILSVSPIASVWPPNKEETLWGNSAGGESHQTCFTRKLTRYQGRTKKMCLRREKKGEHYVRERHILFDTDKNLTLKSAKHASKKRVDVRGNVTAVERGS